MSTQAARPCSDVDMADSNPNDMDSGFDDSDNDSDTDSDLDNDLDIDFDSDTDSENNPPGPYSFVKMSGSIKEGDIPIAPSGRGLWCIDDEDVDTPAKFETTIRIASRSGWAVKLMDPNSTNSKIQKRHKRQKHQSSSSKRHRIQQQKSTQQDDRAYWLKRVASKEKRLIRRQKRDTLWVESTAVTDIEIVKYTYPSPAAVLETMLKEIAIQNAARYGPYLSQQPHLATQLTDLLRNEALAVFNGRDLDREHLLSIGGSIPQGSSIYLHLLWKEADPFTYLYVGQSTETEKRITNHENPEYRQRNPTLHYFVWQSLGPDVNSAWIILSAPEPSDKLDPLTLNCVEMWCSLVLQTLPKELLIRYLNCLPETLSPRAGCHLNIASPLTQSDRSNRPEDVELGNMYNSDDLAVKEFYMDRQRQYMQLRTSNDPILREHWWDNFRRGVQKQKDKKRKSISEMLLSGTEVKVFFKNSNQILHLGPCTFHIPLWVVRLDASKTLHVQCFISDEPVDDCFALESLPSDDAARLLMRIRGTTSDGKLFDGPAYAGGRKTVFKINSLFDILSGRSFGESCKLPGRWRKVEVAGRKQTTYTGSS